MSETRNRNRNGFSRGRTHDLCKLISITRHQKLTHTGTIQLRMDVIDPNLSLAFRENARCEREKRRCAYRFAPREHFGKVNRPAQISARQITSPLAMGSSASANSLRKSS